ncbi:MAG: hypothetical protein IPN02_06655 [Candidatus Microthrix sp.]|uniref:Uncharacterized protein n=1 Tax=Candidatus Neomicrothrix subdominans TaxID=2954438 RepID=A0A936NA73_9ACTN|nr:hypothetical protein [Candidatus Microthrix subdominans]
MSISIIARDDFDHTFDATDVNLIPASWENLLQTLHLDPTGNNLGFPVAGQLP